MCIYIYDACVYNKLAFLLLNSPNEMRYCHGKVHMTLFIHAFGLVEDLKGQAELMVQPISTSQCHKETTISLGHVSNPSLKGGGGGGVPSFPFSFCSLASTYLFGLLLWHVH